MALKVRSARGPLPSRAAAVAIPIHPGTRKPTLGAGAEVLDSLGIDAAAALTREKASGRAGEVVTLTAQCCGVGQVLLVGVGDGSERSLRKAAAAVVRHAKSSRSVATTLATGLDPAAARAIAEAAGLAAYRFSARSDDQPPTLATLTLVVESPAAVRSALSRAASVVEAVCLARDLANMPASTKSPDWLAERAREVTEAAGVVTTVRNEAQLAAEGFGGVLAVGAGSSRPPRLLEMTWSPPEADRHVVLVGKGITFDSGGLSLKPSDSMVGMKTDMAGGAAVIATMTALRALEIGVKVTGLVPLAENMPGAAATRPGDVVRHYGGRTSEVLNTDAEGRLVLADALAYATSTLAPDVIVDIATLTGAASLGLGKRHGALYATNPALAGGLLAAAETAGERLWQMPLLGDYRDALNSPIADLRNIADPDFRYSGGSILAALFLREFVGGAPWAHLDVAGPARSDADEDEVTKGATGFGVRTLLRWLSVA